MNIKIIVINYFNSCKTWLVCTEAAISQGPVKFQNLKQLKILNYKFKFKNPDVQNLEINITVKMIALKNLIEKHLILKSRGGSRQMTD